MLVFSVSAIIKHMGKEISEEEFDRRMQICRECPFFNKRKEVCKKCGCFMKIKTRLENSHCPIGKW